MTTADPREPYGRIAWDAYQDWLADQPRPWPLDRRISWDELDTDVREMHMQIGAAAAAAAEARLAEVGEAVSTFLAVRVCGTDTHDLAEGIRQILDRQPAPGGG